MTKVLVVEDEYPIREMIALNLRMAGYEVTDVESAEAALTLFDADYEVAVLDIMLPGMNGFVM